MSHNSDILSETFLPNCPPRFSTETEKCPEDPKLWQKRQKKAQKPALYGHVLPFSGKKGGFREKDENPPKGGKQKVDYDKFIIFAVSLLMHRL